MKDKSIINRIVLIGNGFDLHHKLNTSYKDFMKHIVKTLLKDHSEIRIADNNLIEYINIRRQSVPFKNEDMFNKLLQYHSFDKKCNFKSLDINYSHIHDFGTINFKNLFFKELIKNDYNGWNDIETIYYDILKEKLENNDEKALNKLNEDFEIIIKHLENYLSLNDNASVIDKVKSFIYDDIKKNDLSQEFLKYNPNIDFNVCEEKILLLDFNYTSTSSLYSKRTNSKNPNYQKSNLIKIHGSLNDLKNPIIFGFGDELDTHYDLIEQSRINGCTKYIKSVNYLKTDNYRNFLSFLELNPFQVIILGHSCGLTDRTLLHYLFEHDNCISIKPYYRDRDKSDNNYLDIVSNISKIFKNKNKLRDRVVNFSYCESINEENISRDI